MSARICTGRSRRKVALLCFGKDEWKLKPVYDILADFADVDVVHYSPDVWRRVVEYDCVVAYLASGIVIRGMCRYLRNKWVDPAVVVLDKPMKHAVVLLGGHHGGNEVASILERIGIKAVITTAMEFSSGLSVGVGFRKDAGVEEILHAINRALEEVGFSIGDVRVIATVESKKGSEIVEVADRLKKPLIFVKASDLNSMDLRETKGKMIGVKNVAEGCAIYTSSSGELLLPKRVYGGVTVAIAR